MHRKLAGILVLCLLGGVSSASPLRLGRWYKDESTGFKIRVPRKWEQVPTKFREVAVVGKWVGRRKRGYYAPSLLVLRFLEAPSAEGETPADAARRGIPGYGGMLRFQPKNVWEYVNRSGRLQVVEEDTEVDMGRRGHSATIRIYKQPLRGGGERRDAEKFQAFFVAAEIRSEADPGTNYGVIFSATVADEEDMRRTFEYAIRGFGIIEPDEVDEEDSGAGDADIFVDSSEKPEAWREARKKKLIRGWRAIDTENYLVLYNEEVKPRLVRTIARHIEAIREQIYEKLFPPAREVTAISVVRVCKDREEYHRYGGPGGSAGYWSRGDEELVFYQDKSNKKDSLRVLYHEAFHQYIHYAVGDVAPHSWFNEGHGDYFAGHNYRSGKFRPDVFRWRTGTISNAISSGTYVPLRDFLKYTQRQYYANPGLCYAQGWSLVYFLREVERRKIKKYKKYWGLLDAYFEAIKKNVQTVKEGGLEGLEPGGGAEEPGPDPVPYPGEEAGEEPDEDAGPGIRTLPGLEEPFPGENPEAGAPPRAGPEEAGPDETRTVAGPRIRGVRSALDAAVDRVFFQTRRFTIEELEKDWIEFMKDS